MEATEKKATPINDFYDYLFSIEREMEAVEDAQKRLAISCPLPPTDFLA